jgi:hypothetical protein
MISKQIVALVVLFSELKQFKIRLTRESLGSALCFVCSVHRICCQKCMNIESAKNYEEWWNSIQVLLQVLLLECFNACYKKYKCLLLTNRPLWQRQVTGFYISLGLHTYSWFKSTWKQLSAMWYKLIESRTSKYPIRIE